MVSDPVTIGDAMQLAIRDQMLLLALLNHQRHQKQRPGSRPSELLRAVMDLVLTLHEKLRNLVPNRHDLHTLVDDDAVRNVTSLKSMFPLVMHASTAMQSLESEARAETTQLWQDQAQARMKMTTTTTDVVVGTDPTDHDDYYEMRNAEFIINSVLYLIYKAELCNDDKQDFYLQHIWAPRIQVEGPAYLRTVLDDKFGDYTRTKTWLKGLLPSESGPPSTWPTHPRGLIRQAWVDTILFRKDHAMELPEIFSLDSTNIQLLRLGCQRAVAACALALHANITTPIDRQSSVWQRREDLAQALVHQRSRTYETDVSDAVVAMAKASSSTWNDDVSLRNRTVAVLRGQDPVIQVLDRRMKEAFVEAIVMDGPTVPTVLKSGVGNSTMAHTLSTTTEAKTGFERVAEDLFCKKGLSFYASELAILCGLARKIVDLVWLVHHELIEQTFREMTSDA